MFLLEVMCVWQRERRKISQLQAVHFLVISYIEQKRQQQQLYSNNNNSHNRKVIIDCNYNKIITGACAGECRQIERGRCPGGNDCLTDVGNEVIMILALLLRHTL